MRSLRLSASLGLLLLLPAAGLAQSAAAWRDSATRLAIAARALQDSMIHGDAAAVEVARHGDLVIAASPKVQDLARRVFDRIGEIHDRWFGNAAPTRDGFRVVVTVDTYEDPTGDSQDRERSSIRLTGLPDTGVSKRNAITVGTSDVMPQLINQYTWMMFGNAPPKLSTWLGGPPSLTDPEPDRRELAMYAFVTGSGRSERACVSGKLAACAQALGLVAPSPGDSGDAGVPFFPLVRADLFLTALEIGGPEAWTRAVSDSQAVAATILVTAAGIPLDSLLARWRSGLLARRPHAGPFAGTTAALAATWIVAMLLGALGASRWA